MCGITGFYDPSAEEIPDGAVIRRMAAPLAHRGPDDEGFHHGPGIALGFRRLSIVDLAGGHQPLANEDGTVLLVMNGEIYNHLDLRPELEGRGHRFRTRSDAEAVLHAYEEWGVDCLERLQGMFAFALYDRPRHRLLLARDRLGIKPLHVAELDDGTLVFGSEIKSLLAHPGVPREASEEAAALFLTYRYLPSPHTLFRGIRKLPPGHRLVADRNGTRTEMWWDVDLSRRFAGSYDDACEALREHVRTGIRDRLMADVPLGALLSGGLDSSIVVSLMRGMHDGPVKTFSVGFSGASGNDQELPFAREVARAFETEHHELVMEERDLPGAIRSLIWHMDEPLVEPAAIPVYLISKLARETVTVVLTGEGADELFAGYPKYGRDHLARSYARVPRFLRESLVRKGLDAVPLPLRRVRVAERSLSIPDPSERWASWFAGFAGPERRAVLHPDLLRRLDDPTARGPLSGWVKRAAERDPLTRMLYADVKTWLADDLLMKMDRMSMAASLEARVPFLDHRTVEFAFSLPPEWKWRGGRGKRILRDTFGPDLPPRVLSRAKTGFPVPIDSWFRNGLRGFVADTLLDGAVERRGVLNAATVRRLVEDHASGRRDYRREIWTLLNLELWYRLYIDAPGPPLVRPAEMAGPPI